MKSSKNLAIAVIAASVLMVGCASPNYSNNNSGNYPARSQSYSTVYGVVDSIQITQASTNSNVGAGTVVGGLVGGLLGNQVGGGSGRAIATVAGAVGGAVVGNQLEQNRRPSGPDVYVVGVRLDNGSFQSYTQENIADVRIGNRVRIDNGRVSRY
jgi:outer membrane lipoprotein SlyB